MKTYLLTGFLLCTTSILFSQEILLKDSVIYFDKKPVALYTTRLSNSMPRYNIDVFGLDGKPAIEAEVIEFVAPVRELKSFYYYELRFPGVKDTFSFYHNGEAFTQALAKLIADYKLLAGNQIDTAAVSYFKANYIGGKMLQVKINEVTDYLNVTRNFDEQVIRDRTKPVTIINDRVIMQDGVKIGNINTIQNVQSTNTPIYATGQKAAHGQPPVTYTYIADYVMKVSEETEIRFANGRKIEPERVRNQAYFKNKIGGNGYQLFEVSKKKKYKIGSGNESLLRWICFLIEDYDL